MPDEISLDVLRNACLSNPCALCLSSPLVTNQAKSVLGIRKFRSLDHLVSLVCVILFSFFFLFSSKLTVSALNDFFVKCDSMQTFHLLKVDFLSSIFNSRNQEQNFLRLVENERVKEDCICWFESRGDLARLMETT